MESLCFRRLSRKLRLSNRWAFAVFPLLKNERKTNMRRSGRPSALFTRSQPSKLPRPHVCMTLIYKSTALRTLPSHIQNRILQIQKIRWNVDEEDRSSTKNTVRRYYDRLLLSRFRNSKRLMLWEPAVQHRSTAQRLHTQAHDRHELCVIIFLVARRINTSFMHCLLSPNTSRFISTFQKFLYLNLMEKSARSSENWQRKHPCPPLLFTLQEA